MATLNQASAKQNTTKPGTSALGKFKDEVLSAPKAAVKSLAQEPKKILESILGKADTGTDADGDGGVEDLVAGGADPAVIAAQQKAHQQKVIQSQQDAQKKLQLHRQRLQEEQQYFARRQQEEEMKKQQEEQQEEEEKQHEIVQMKREKGLEQRDRQLAGRQGSKEQGRGKKF